MHPIAWLPWSLLVLPFASAFYIHHHEAPTVKKDGRLSIGTYAAKAFAFNGPDSFRISANAIQKKLPSVKITKRAASVCLHPSRPAIR
jgi:hypothetical protein